MTLSPKVLSDYTWQLHFDIIRSVCEVTLTYNRLLPDGTTVKFDEDPHGILDLSLDEDDHLVMDGVIALLPSHQLISCTLRDVRRVFGVWQQTEYKHINAGYDTDIVRTAFEARLWNPDSSVDFILIGGDAEAHTTTAILHVVKLLNEQVLGHEGDARIHAIEHILEYYSVIVYTQTTEVHVVSSMEGEQTLAQIKGALAMVASRYEMIIPSR